MPFPSQSPYEILGLLPSASQAEIMQAYVRASRERKYSSVLLAQAFSDLRDAAKRAEHDLFIVSAGQNAQEVADLVVASSKSRSSLSPELPFDLAITSLHATSDALQPHALPSRPLELSSDSPRLLEAEQHIPEIPFPEGG